MLKELYYMIAWVSIWFCMCAFAHEVLQIDNTEYVMAWGVVSYTVTNFIIDWVRGNTNEIT